MDSERQRVFQLLDEHSQKASQSEYDRAVCVAAVSRARDEIQSIPDTVLAANFRAEARKRMGALIDGYHDSDGDYTSGRSVLVPFLDDLYGED
jgi:hypothetical protein